jgi:hypothetical protein
VFVAPVIDCGIFVHAVSGGDDRARIDQGARAQCQECGAGGVLLERDHLTDAVHAGAQHVLGGAAGTWLDERTIVGDDPKNRR